MHPGPERHVGVVRIAGLEVAGQDVLRGQPYLPFLFGVGLAASRARGAARAASIAPSRGACGPCGSVAAGPRPPAGHRSAAGSAGTASVGRRTLGRRWSAAAPGFPGPAARGRTGRPAGPGAWDEPSWSAAFV